MRENFNWKNFHCWRSRWIKPWEGVSHLEFSRWHKASDRYLHIFSPHACTLYLVVNQTTLVGMSPCSTIEYMQYIHGFVRSWRLAVQAALTSTNHPPFITFHEIHRIKNRNYAISKLVLEDS